MPPPVPLSGSIRKRLFVLTTLDNPPFAPLKLSGHVKPAGFIGMIGGYENGFDWAFYTPATFGLLTI
jgi:hypothetical protein